MTAIDSSTPKSHGILRGNDWWEASNYPAKKAFRAEEQKAANRRGLTLEEFRELRYDGDRIVRGCTLSLIAGYRAGAVHEVYVNVLAGVQGENWMLVDQLPTYPDRENRANVGA
jgi:hypothetical protein